VTVVMCSLAMLSMSILVSSTIIILSVGIILFFNINITWLIPSIPYWNGALLSISLFSLAAMVSLCGVYNIRLIDRLMCRLKHNKAPLQQSYMLKKNQIRKGFFTVSAVFVISLLLFYFVGVYNTGTFEFWNAWGLFI